MDCFVLLGMILTVMVHDLSSTCFGTIDILVFSAVSVIWSIVAASVNSVRLFALGFASFSFHGILFRL